MEVRLLLQVRMGLELPDGAASVYAADNAYAEMGSAGPSFRARR